MHRPFTKEIPSLPLNLKNATRLENEVFTSRPLAVLNLVKGFNKLLKPDSERVLLAMF